MAERQPGTPSGGNPPASDLRSVASKIEGLLDDDGHYNPNPDQLSRGHPDYDESTDDRAQPRNKAGRFAKADTDDTDDGQELIEDTLDDEQPDDAADTSEDEDDDESTTTDEAPTDDEDTDDDSDAINSIAALAEALEMPLDELTAQLTHTFRAADEDVTVTLAELATGYQKDADYRRSTAQLAEFRRASETELQARHQTYEAQQHVAAQQLNLAEQMLTVELNSPKLAALRESAPDEWTAQRTEIGERLGYLQQTRQQAAAEYEQFRVNNLAQLRAREMQTLTEAIPDFGADHSALAKEVISSLGYTDEEVVQIFDSRLVRGALELGALRKRVTDYEAREAKAADTAKRVKKSIPKLVRPGKHVSPGAKGKRLQRDNVKRLQTRLKKSGRVEDAAAIIETMMDQ